MLKAIIIDDESKARDLLELLIQESGREVEVVGKYPTLITGVAGIKAHQPDVVFLDIEMPEVQGVQLLEYIPNPDFEIVFATAYDQYAIKAFELSALDYLLKPIDDEKLNLTLDKVGKHKLLKERLLTYEQNRQEEAPLKICIPTSNNKYDVVLVQDIMGVEADRNYCYIHTVSKKYFLTKSLSHFEEKYMPLNSFERSHRSWIVNLNQVARFEKTEKKMVMQHQNLVIPISRANLERIYKQMKGKYAGL
ncbi:MAG: LytR/AlgR family response regulator transcription factor [Aureispira sp.]